MNTARTIPLHIAAASICQIVVALFSATSMLNAVEINGVDLLVAPPGEPIHVTGSGFTGTTAVTFCWATARVPASFVVVDDTLLEVVMPDLDRVGRKYFMIVETASGTTVTLRHRIIGPETDPQSLPPLRLNVYVKAGGVLEINNDVHGLHIFAENGAILDFTGAGDLYSTNLYLSPETLVIGQIPAGDSDTAIRYITPLNPSEPRLEFQKGFALHFTIIGDGTIETIPDLPYFPGLTDIDLVAKPGPTAFFTSWSGAFQSTSSHAQVRVEFSDLNITATFSAGYAITQYVSTGGHVTLSPDRSVFQPGEMVTLTAHPHTGYQFLGWGGDIQGTQASAAMTMQSNRTIMAGFRTEVYGDLPSIESVDHQIVPAGEIITVRGNGFTDATNVTLRWMIDESPAGFTVIDDATLHVEMPDLMYPGRSYHMLIETSSGSTVSGTGRSVLPGSIRETSPNDSLVYVYSGGVLKITDDLYVGYIYAEDGAIVDFTGANPTVTGKLFHSPGTKVTGHENISFTDFEFHEIPSLARQSANILFEAGYRVRTTIVGNGTVRIIPDQPYFSAITDVQLIAEPAEGSFFVNWSGDVESVSTTVDVRVVRGDLNLTATFTTGRILTLHASHGGTVQVNPLKAMYDDGEIVSLTAQADAGFSFIGWGGALAGHSPSAVLTLDDNKIVLAGFRSDDYSSLPHLDLADKQVAPPGEIVTLHGSGLSDTTAVSFKWAVFTSSAEFTVVDDNILEIIMPVLDRDVLGYHVLVETASGATVGSGGNGVQQVPAGQIATIGKFNRLVFVEAGAMLQITGTVHNVHIYAEDGAILHFANPLDFFASSVCYSPGTRILGILPDGFTDSEIRMLTSLRSSQPVGAFQAGYPLTVVVEGPGSVSIDPDSQRYSRGEIVRLVATPDPGNYFIRWIGTVSGRNPEQEFSVLRNSQMIARFSSRMDYFTSWRLQHFTPGQLADPLISSFSADPDGDFYTNAAEYAFGTDPMVAEQDSWMRIYVETEEGLVRHYLTYVRPSTAIDIEYRVEVSQDMSNWNYNGDGSDTTYTVEIGAEPIDAEVERVTVELYPDDPEPVFILVRIHASIL